MKENKARVKYALHATRAAAEEGILPGEWVALSRAEIVLEKLELKGDEPFGVNIVRRACEEPVRQIVVNCGIEGAVVVERIKHQRSFPGLSPAHNRGHDLQFGVRRLAAL